MKLPSLFFCTSMAVRHVLAIIPLTMLSTMDLAQNTYPWPSTGNVGVGTTAPITTLDINGSFHTVTNTQLIPPSNGNGGLEILWNRSAGGAEVNFYNLYTAAGLSYLFSQKTGETSCADLMAIYANGRVMIGSGDPGSNKLAVDGTIGARKVVVTQVNPFPDYVFEPRYRALSLDSLSGYIRAHHHLPEIPSADSVARSGLDLGNNQTLLLKKIEELTLYIIEQNKKIDILTERILKLEAKK